MLKKLFAALLSEIAKNGKMLVAYLMMQIPGLTDYPGIVDAINAVMVHPTKENAANLVAQLVMTFGAGHRFVKIAKSVFRRVLK